MAHTADSARITGRPSDSRRWKTAAIASFWRAQVIAGAVALGAGFPAHAEPRGELLYSIHCLGCHTEKMHWRDARAATDWPGVVAQVRKWQSASSLLWDEQDVLAVARYLNDSFYHVPPSAPSPAASTNAARRPSLQIPLASGGGDRAEAPRASS